MIVKLYQSFTAPPTKKDANCTLKPVRNKLAQKIDRVHWVHGTHAYRANRRSYPQWKSTVQLQYVHCYVVLTRNSDDNHKLKWSKEQ